MVPNGTSPHNAQWNRIIPGVNRLRRWIFRGSAALSLILCIVTFVFFVRSHWKPDSVCVWGWHIEPNQAILPPRLHGCSIHVISSHGRIEVYQIYPVSIPPSAPEYYNLVDIRPDQSRSFGFPGFHFEKSWFSPSFLAFPGKYDGTTRHLAISDWLLILIAAILPITSLTRKLNRTRHAPGHCQHCGYDLRATPDRCPECGKIADQAV